MTKKITITTINGAQTVNATVIDGLAYHHRCIGIGAFSKDEWVVTHVASGRNPLPESFSFHAEEACRVFIEEIRHLVNWSLPAEELWKQYGELYAPSSAAIAEALKKAYRRALDSQYKSVQIEP